MKAIESDDPLLPLLLDHFSSILENENDDEFEDEKISQTNDMFRQQIENYDEIAAILDDL